MSNQGLSLTPNEEVALRSLRQNQEEFNKDEITPGMWADVYLDNAIPFGWSPEKWRSILGSLTKKELYIQVDGYAFGKVRF